MPKTFEKHSVEQISVFTESLMKCAANFATGLQSMQSAGMKEAYIEWSKKHFDSWQLMSEAAVSAMSMIEAQVGAFRSGIPSSYETQNKKVQKAADRRKAKVVNPKKPSLKNGSRPGRPRKSK